MVFIIEQSFGKRSNGHCWVQLIQNTSKIYGLQQHQGKNIKKSNEKYIAKESFGQSIANSLCLTSPVDIIYAFGRG